jgi:uncharacterized protein (TIGR00730 family)
MSAIRSLCVYCGAYAGKDPTFAGAAESVGRLLASRKIEIVFGGGLRGLMGVMARAAIQSGGHVTGVIPESLRRYAEASCSKLIFVKSMHERKQMMFDHSDAFLALPGGLGTLEELMEQLKWIQLGHHSKPVFLLDVSGYWTPLLSLLRHMQKTEFLELALDELVTVCADTEQLESALDSAVIA